MNHAILTSDELQVVVGNNEPGTSRFADHRAGYNGVWSLQSRHYAEPIFYGRPGDGRMMLLCLFAPNPGLRIVQSPVGSGWAEEALTWNPAWDFHLLTRPAVAGQEISLRGRFIYKPFESRDDILQMLEEWKREW